MLCVCAVPPTVTPRNERPIGVETRDGSPSEIIIGFSITRDFPPVVLDDITWTYTRRDSTEQEDVAILASNSTKYTLSSNLRSLTITNLNFSDAGYFNLTASNEAGVGIGRLQLIIHGKSIYHFLNCCDSL